MPPMGIHNPESLSHMVKKEAIDAEKRAVKRDLVLKRQRKYIPLNGRTPPPTPDTASSCKHCSFMYAIKNM